VNQRIPKKSMANNYFQFLQFIVRQDRCAMKVCTDSCLLGAWFAERIPAGVRVLDIGAGSGLLMLMLAQKNGGEIHGIEIDPGSHDQLGENLACSPWKERLHPYPGDVRDFPFPAAYDFIISNPPFFEDSLNSPSERANLARHSRELTLDELIGAIDRNLSPSGSFGILLPCQRSEEFEALAERHHFSLKQKLSVRQRPGRDYFRSILHFSRLKEASSTALELCIHNETGAYSGAFVELLKDYYLNL
jgi:tRNA1Val (adenine37-N6)-methyltransferase